MNGVLNETTNKIHKHEHGRSDFQTTCGATAHVAHDDLREVAEFVDARVVDDGDVLTCGGVTSGFDLAFHFLAREFGQAVRDRVASEMEYEPSGDVYRG